VTTGQVKYETTGLKVQMEHHRYSLYCNLLVILHIISYILNISNIQSSTSNILHSSSTTSKCVTSFYEALMLGLIIQP
jgi:hypothetical protein